MSPTKKQKMGNASASPTPVKLYTNPGSFNSMRVEIVLLEMGIPYEAVKVELSKGEHKQEAYTALNARQQVPFLQDGEIGLNESVAIIEYLNRKYPNEEFYPTSDTALLAKTCKYIAEFHQKFDPKNIFGALFFGNQTREALKGKLDALRAELKTWDGYLSGDRTYLVFPDKPSVADFVVYPSVCPCYELYGLPEGEFPNLDKWYNAMKQRPSIQKVPTAKYYEDMIAKKPELKVLAKI